MLAEVSPEEVCLRVLGWGEAKRVEIASGWHILLL